MKKVIIITSLACIVFSACSNNPNNASETPAVTEQKSMSVDSTRTDSTKAAADKMAKDSADAAHGHTH